MRKLLINPVFRQVRLRMRNLQGLGTSKQERENKSIVDLTPSEIRSLSQQCNPSSSPLLRLHTLSDAEVLEQVNNARDWLLSVLQYHSHLLLREGELRMLRSAVEKQLTGRQETWSEKERLYMTLTDQSLASPRDRLISSIILVLNLNLAEHLKEVSRLADRHCTRMQRTIIAEDELVPTHGLIVEKIQSNIVDHFACAIPLSLLSASRCGSVLDANAGCCPVCQNDYTAFTMFSIKDLLEDYPIRIKYCGHIIGKACLERWMNTPKIDEARYPFRTCPLCRVKIEGVPAPRLPEALKQHTKTSRRAMDTIRELTYGWGMELEECFDSIVVCMSEEIACEQLLAEVQRQRGSASDSGSTVNEKLLLDKLDQLNALKRAWGFRGEGAWRKTRDEWMNSGVIRKEY